MLGQQDPRIHRAQPLFFPPCVHVKKLPMAILKVTRLGHPVLRKVTENISLKELKTAAMQRFIDDMVETMKEYDGVGLAADQVFTSRQIAVLEVADNPRYPNKGKVPLSVLVNPKITPLSDEMEEDWEGCLSIPDLRGMVPRYNHIHVTALDRDGNKLDFVAKGFPDERNHFLRAPRRAHGPDIGRHEHEASDLYLEGVGIIFGNITLDEFQRFLD